MQEKPQPRYATSEEYLAAKQSEGITEIENLFHEQEDIIATLQATKRAMLRQIETLKSQLEECAKERQVAWATYADEHGRVRQLEGVVREIVREWDERGDGRVTRAVEDKARALIDSARDD